MSRAISNTGELGTPESGHGRTVDMATSVKDVLQRQETTLNVRWPGQAEKPTDEMPAWCFPSDAWTPQDHSNVGKAFRKILKAAGLLLHYSPHSLRHSFASQLLQGSVSPAYVQRMLGHASIALTVDTYGRWLPMGNLANVDKLDEGFKLPEVVAVGQSGSHLVAKAFPRPSQRPQVIVGVGDPPWTRTMNPEIKSLLLYQLS